MPGQRSPHSSRNTCPPFSASSNPAQCVQAGGYRADVHGVNSSLLRGFTSALHYSSALVRLQEGWSPHLSRRVPASPPKEVPLSVFSLGAGALWFPNTKISIQAKLLSNIKPRANALKSLPAPWTISCRWYVLKIDSKYRYIRNFQKSHEIRVNAKLIL